MILFLLALCLFWSKHSCKALWLVAKEESTILGYELVGGNLSGVMVCSPWYIFNLNISGNKRNTL